MASVSGTRGFSAMRLSILGSYKRRLAQGAAIIILGGLASGCSSDAMRFSYGSDGMFTGATSNQRQIIAPNQALSRRQRSGRRGRRLAHGLDRPRGRQAGRSVSVRRQPHYAGAGRRHEGCGRRLPAAAQGQEPRSGAGRVGRPRQDRHRHGEVGSSRPRPIRSAGRAPAARRSPPRKARPSTICRAASACLPTC